MEDGGWEWIFLGVGDGVLLGLGMGVGDGGFGLDRNSETHPITSLTWYGIIYVHQLRIFIFLQG